VQIEKRYRAAAIASGRQKKKNTLKQQGTGVIYLKKIDLMEEQMIRKCRNFVC
jgi:hypothetical protein